MEKMVITILIMSVLGMNYWSCAGFPVYDYGVTYVAEALNFSMAKVNSRYPSPYLFRAFRNSVKQVDLLDDGSLIIVMELSIKETTCRRDSGEDPATCDFRKGYLAPTAVCRSLAWVSALQVQEVQVRCFWSSSSESSSSEEMFFGDTLGSSKWRNNYLLDTMRYGNGSLEQNALKGIEVPVKKEDTS
ncbi:Secreted Phosphoprotein 24 [Manis pentadactyla]|nr:Secreted Phosphoprotein 24 [Manis pentadactyla]